MNNKIPLVIRRNQTTSIIRWNRSDYARLSYAVRQFNKTINKLESIDRDILPEEMNYKELRDNIYSRKELNRIVNSLRRFSKESQQQIVKIPSGEELTKWEVSELKKAQKRAISNIQWKAWEIIDSDRNVMGDTEYKRLKRTRESIEDLFNRSGSEFTRTSRRTLYWGRKDYDLLQAERYRENFMNSLKTMSNFDNYELLVSKLEKIENPIRFYEYIEKSDILSDLFLYYNDAPTSQTYGGFSSNQEAFDTAIFDQLGIKRPNE